MDWRNGLLLRSNTQPLSKVNASLALLLLALLRPFTFLLGFIFSSSALAFNLSLNGSFTQGGMVVGQVQGVEAVYFQGEALKLSESGDFVFGFGRDFPDSAELVLWLPGGKQVSEPIEVEKRQYNIQRVEGIDKKIMSKEKPDSVWARIKNETKAVKNARAEHVESLAFKSQFKWPLVAPISGVYGSQRVYNGEPGRPHYGVDMAAPVGTPVVAPADAVVTLSDDLYYSGGTIIMDHGYGVSSSFLHLSELLVKVGDQIKQGQVVGKVGAGGRSSGPHLDWRMNWYKQRIDPQLLVPEMPK